MKARKGSGRHGARGALAPADLECSKPNASPHGRFPESTRAIIIQQCARPLNAARRASKVVTTMSDVAILRSVPIDLTSELGRQFVVDCTRAGEGLITDKELQEIYELSPADWIGITKNVALGRAIRAERDRRVRNGTAAREAACKHLVKAPGNPRSNHDGRKPQTRGIKSKQLVSCGRRRPPMMGSTQRNPRRSSSKSTSPPPAARLSNTKLQTSNQSPWRQSPMANESNGPSFFARYIDEPKGRTRPPAWENAPAEKLLNWISEGLGQGCPQLA